MVHPEFEETRVDLGLNGRVALVSGASSGIGFAVAEELAAAGCFVMMTARTLSKPKPGFPRPRKAEQA